MTSLIEWCAGCQAHRRMVVTTSRSEKVDADGKIKVATNRSVQCESCRMTLRIEKIEGADP